MGACVKVNAKLSQTPSTKDWYETITLKRDEILLFYAELFNLINCIAKFCKSLYSEVCRKNIFIFLRMVCPLIAMTQRLLIDETKIKLIFLQIALMPKRNYEKKMCLAYIMS